MNETIINGIDVSECDYFEKQHIEDMYELDDCNVCIDNFCALCWKECEKHNGCYFKQLQRLKKENNILRKTIKDKNIVGVCEQSTKYKQVLEEIREIINEQNLILDKPISQSEFTLGRLCNYEEKYIKIIDKVNEVLNEK